MLAYLKLSVRRQQRHLPQRICLQGWSSKPQRVRRTDTHQSLPLPAPASERESHLEIPDFWEVIAKVSRDFRTSLVKMLISFSGRNIDVKKGKVVCLKFWRL